MRTLFDEHVARAAGGAASERNLLPAIEKELLHHDILRTMQESGLLKTLVFFGGTSLRLCHGSKRLSEDLDFKGGKDFSPSRLERLPRVLIEGLTRKYGLEVDVEEPKPKEGNTATWTIRVITRPASKSEKQQRISIDVCSLVNYERAPSLLTNYYSADLGTAGLILQVQSKRETYTDKLIACAFRNRLKGRDLWDLAWLKQTLADSTPVRLAEKAAEHGHDAAAFLAAFESRLALVRGDQETWNQFVAEMTRFLPASLLETARNPDFWAHIGNLMEEELGRCGRLIGPASGASWF